MDNAQANSNLGTAARKLSFAFSDMIHKNYDEHQRVDQMQEALYHFGLEIAHKAAMYATKPETL